MPQIITLSLPPAAANEHASVRAAIENYLRLKVGALGGFNILKRSLDARGKQPKIILLLEVFNGAEKQESQTFDPQLQNVQHAPEGVIIGAGPAGIFAALKLISQGIKPIIFERGKDVKSRRRDLALLNKSGIVNPESNYCFGEGGAGTYSDGKLYTRSTKRGDVKRILELFIHFGANPEIRFEAHPHIGTNKLPNIITKMRDAIVECGGEVHFDSKLTDIFLKNKTLKGIEINGAETFFCKAIILATGHSARDVFELLQRKKISTESKPFALGVRIEHPQEVINKARYHCKVRNELLPPAAYSLVSQTEGRGVFSFCMCPGGIIAPAATSPNEIVVNGWSPSKRNNPFANSGTVVTVDENDFKKQGFEGALSGIQYQQMVEQKCFEAGGGNLVAPAQRMTDFVSKISSSTLPKCSYLPGICSINLHEVLPKEITVPLAKALKEFGKKMKGYFTNDAVLVATESRTSSPVRIPRDKVSLQHPEVEGLFPCAEGAGYAGGIVSAAIDGENCASALAQKILAGK